jgi:hypothetical protein
MSKKIEALHFLSGKNAWHIESYFNDCKKIIKVLGKKTFNEIREKKINRALLKEEKAMCPRIKLFRDVKKEIIYCLTYNGWGGDWCTYVKECYSEAGVGVGIIFKSVDEPANNKFVKGEWAFALLERLKKEYNYSELVG